MTIKNKEQMKRIDKKFIMWIVGALVWALFLGNYFIDYAILLQGLYFMTLPLILIGEKLI